MIKKISILKSNYIGVYARAWEDIAIVPLTIEDEVVSDFEEVLGVEVKKTLVNNSNLIGSMTVMNSNGIIVAQNGWEGGFEVEMPGRNTLYLKDKFNAVGNDIIANNHAALIHTGFNNTSRKKIEDTLGVEVLKGTIGGIKTVGSVGVVTQKGMLVAPEASEEEQEFLSKLFKVPVKAGTANFGNMYIGSSIIANSKGVLVGKDTTPIELGRIDDIFS
ncbi:translation initiation factor 6 [uncultured archaeon]|nr:translation initiation factor 6 [uncultured archaeon]HKJ96201.1 translation initiation factor IF-6 [Thermoplasmataceae archaeon]